MKTTLALLLSFAALPLCAQEAWEDAPNPKLQVLPAAGDANHAAVTETRAQRDARMDWWRQAKFGMFIHFGLYSGLGGEFRGQPGGAEWIQTNLGLDTETYAKEAMPLFRPSVDCAEDWAKLAEEAGCRYMVLTSKHHDGFALFDAPNSDYSSQKLLGRDLVREFTEACRRHGMRVGLYHSVIDWHNKDYDNTICPPLCYPKGQETMLKARGIPRNHAAYQSYLHEQVRTLLTRYGQVDILWWDYSQGAAEGERGWKAPELITMCRRLQPGVIMNNRLYAYSGLDAAADDFRLDLRCGDFGTPEKRIPEKGYEDMDWEACMTVGDKWGYNRMDVNLKSPAELIARLQECVAKGGNFLLNIGPKGDGSVPEGLREAFLRVGAWMKQNGEAVYGTRPADTVHPQGGLMCSMVGENIYVFLPAERPQGGEYLLRIPAVELDEMTASILGQEGTAVSCSRVEEAPESEDDPQAFMEFRVPASVWDKAEEGMPVLKLSLKD